VSSDAEHRNQDMMKKTVFFAVITVVGFLLLSDIALRVFMPRPPARRWEWPPPDKTRHGMMADRTLFWKLRPGYNGPWKIYKLAYTYELAEHKSIDWESRKEMAAPAYRGVTWQVNRDGFRGPPVSRKKRPGTVRLLFLGSSVTFGWGVRAGDAFCETVKERLARSYPQTNFEAINAGVPGYSSYQLAEYLKLILPAYRPDVVVAECGINDGTMAVGKSDKEWHPRAREKIRLLVRNTGWGRLILRLFGPLIKRPAIKDVWQTYDEAITNFYRISMTGTKTRVAPGDFRANLEKMAAMCRENGADFFVYIPTLYNEYGKRRLIPSVDFTGANRIPVYQMLSAYPAGTLETFFLPFDEAHLSVTGHRVVGEYVADFLKAYQFSSLRSAWGRHSPAALRGDAPEPAVPTQSIGTRVKHDTQSIGTRIR